MSFKLHKRGFGGIRPLPIAIKHLRATHDDFTLLTRGHFLQAVGVNHPSIHTNKWNAQTLLFGSVGRVAVRRRCGFGQAIAFDIPQSVQLKQPLRHRLRHGRTAATNRCQRRQIVLVKRGATQQIDHHGRNIGPVRDAPF